MKQKFILCSLIVMSMMTSACSSNATISEEEAQNIALSHAGLTAEQVTFIKSDLDMEDGKQTYDVEFYTEEGKEFDYEIDSTSGEILDFDYDAEYHK